VSSNVLDLRGTPCPLNFVKTKLKLQQLPPGTLLEVWLDAGDPIEQVPDSLLMEGYILEDIQSEQEFFKIKVLRPE
jgi:TusA-related sulfurtransferase